MKLASFPKCFMDELVLERTMSVFDWIEMAADLPIDGLELHGGFLETLDEAYLTKVESALQRHHLEMPMFCHSPDFTKWGADERREEVAREKRKIDVTARLGGRFCRVLSGQRRPGVMKEVGVQWVVECIRELLDCAAEKGVVLAIENHYKDNYWEFPEFAQNSDVFLEIVNRIDSPWFGVQYDPSNAIVAGEDPIELLEKVKSRVVTMHASDRFLKLGHYFRENIDSRVFFKSTDSTIFRRSCSTSSSPVRRSTSLASFILAFFANQRGLSGITRSIIKNGTASTAPAPSFQRHSRLPNPISPMT